MNVILANYTKNPLEEIYKGYRVCYSKVSQSEIVLPKKTPILEEIYGQPILNDVDYDKMIAFIKKYMLMGHQSPLEHVNLTFYIEGVSRALTHQLVRHRLCSFNQQSQRYVDGSNFGYVVPPTIRDSSYESPKLIYFDLIKKITDAYNKLVELGIPQEDARFLLPNACTTNITVTMNLREFRHFLTERLCLGAQWEIRELALLMLELVRKIIPFVGEGVMKCSRCTDYKCPKNLKEAV